MKPNRSALFALASLSLTLAPLRAQETPSFDQLARVRAARPSGDGLGVYMKSDREGKIFFCSASGCRQLLSGGASVAIRAGDGLYYTGPQTTGYCAPSGCSALLASGVTFPLSAGPNGDIYAADAGGLWHCGPSSCARSYSGRVDVRANYMGGAWKTNGDFVASPAGRTFWCARADCRPIAGTELVVVDDSCNNPAPADVSYGFWGLDFYRCTASGCRKLMDSDNIQTYSVCAFDESGRIYMESRAQVAIASVRCGETCEPSPRQVTDVAPDKRRSNEDQTGATMRGTDGAVYRLADRRGTPEPAKDKKNGAELPPIVLRDARPLALDASVACWEWSDGDPDDEEWPSWQDGCRLIR